MRNRRITAIPLALAGVFAVVIVKPPIAKAQEPPRTFWRQMEGGGAQIGASLRDVTDADVRSLKLQAPAGAVINRVDASGPAAKAGFRTGDVVLTFDSVTVRSARHLERLISETPDGRQVTATVVREGTRVELKVAPEAPMSSVRRFMAEPGNVPRFMVPDMPREFPFTFDRFEFEAPRYVLRNEGGRWLSGDGGSRLGVGIQDLTGQLGEYFGTTGGALVTSVEDDSVAKTAGVRAGDVITRVNDQPVKTTADLRRALTTATGEITLTVMRDRKEVTLKTKLDDPVERRRIIR